jgi:hypothetical protein
MEDNLIVEITDLKSIKKNNINFNNKNTYCIWYDKTELEKILLGFLTYTHSYLSCFFSSNTDKIHELIGSYIMIFLKNPKILYGFAKVHSITLKDIPIKSYLEDIDEEYISQLKTNGLILIDNIEFESIIDKYKYIEVPKMFLVKFNYLYQFKYEIGIKKFNYFILNSNEIEKNNLEFKYPTKVQNKEMIKNSNLNFINNLMKYVVSLHNKEQIANHDKIPEISNTDLNKLSGNDNNQVKNKFSIPVLWNGCECIKNMLIYHTTKPNKKIILSHYLSCMDCEINDNNNKMINLENNKKITIKNINEDSYTIIFDLLIDSYKNIESFNIENKNYNNFFEKDKINIISCSKSSSFYSKCLFLVE